MGRFANSYSRSIYRLRMKSIVAIDVDGTVAALDKEWIRRYNRDYNDNMTVEQWTEWDIHKLIKPECGLKIYEYIEDPTIYDDVLPIPFSQVAVGEIKKISRVIFVTNSTVGASGAKYNWLKRYGFLNDLKDYVECKDKSLIRASHLIDDRVENLEDFSGIGLLYQQPWNKNKIWTGNIIFSWERFLFHENK